MSVTLSRRAVLAGGTALFLSAPSLTRAAQPFSTETVIAQAQALSDQPYTPRDTVPQDWLDLTYDQYRDIRFDTKQALWRGTATPYEIDFFAPGLYFPRATQVFTVENGAQTPVAFDLDLFTKGPLVPALNRDAPSLGYSGLRLRTDLGHPSGKTEFCVFQGASYFRAIANGLTYGLSARGLALKTADPEGEEFPDFIRFWLETPPPGQTHMVVHALMDSPSVTGAFRFHITPGTTCKMQVQATLFPRVELSHVGFGPLTSMFLFDETDRTRFDDFRPAVHDSDGLLIENGAGEILWRPLANPLKLQVSSFVDENPRGFGLMQRARDLADFADLEALYHNRPGLWVEPKGNWGKGAVTLVEIPADQEIYDNIVAYWRPETPLPAGQRVDLAYDLTWAAEAPLQHALAKVQNTRMGRRQNGDALVTVDFADVPGFGGDLDDIEIRINSPHVPTSPGILQRNPETGGVRLAFSFTPDERNYAELRAQLRKDGQNLTEVWLYRWTR